MKKISLFGAVSTGVGMLIATSCFVSSASGSSAIGTPFVIAIVIACIANMLAVLSIAELNAIMPNLTGGIAQYTLAGLGPLLTIVTMVGGYLISNVFAAPAEGAMFANVMTEMTDGGRNYTFLVDGEIKGRWSNTYNCAVPAVFMSNTVYADKESVYYVDNLVIKQLAKPKAEAAVSGTMGGDTVEITLSDSFGENVLANVKKDNVAIKNRFGESVEIKSVTASGNRLIIKPQNPFEYDENYTVDLSAVIDIYGRTAPNTEFSSQSEVDDEGNIVLRIKDAKAILYDGTEVNLNGEISPEVCGFEFELNARISEWSGGIKRRTA